MEVCPTIPTVNQVLLDPAQVNFMNNYKKPQNSPFSETYNSEWRNHPNFRWGNSNTNFQNNQPPNFQKPQSSYVPPPMVPFLKA